MSFSAVKQFESDLAQYWGSNYAVATDCCTHAVELCLRYAEPDYISIPKHTYISIPQLAHKLNLECHWMDTQWRDYYEIGNTNIIDSAVYWKRDGYIQNSLQCLSFQFKKPLNLGRGGAILCSTREQYNTLKAMAYDGRDQNSDVYWGKQDIKHMGYHYYMTPETAIEGIRRLTKSHERVTKQWCWQDYPDCSEFSCFADVDIYE